MSLNRGKELSLIAKIKARGLRKNSTDAERILWSELRDRKFLNRKFLRQHPVLYDLLGKESFFIADFFCYEEKLIIELDGTIHELQLKEDEKRTEILNFLGLKVIRFRNKDVINNLEAVLKELKKLIVS